MLPEEEESESILQQRVDEENAREAVVLARNCAELNETMQLLVNSIQQQESRITESHDSIMVAETVSQTAVEEIAEAESAKRESTQRLKRVLIGGVTGVFAGFIFGIPVASFLVQGIGQMAIHAGVTSVGTGLAGMLAGGIV